MKTTTLILLGLLWACVGLVVRGAGLAALQLYDGLTIGMTIVASVVLFLYALELDKWVLIAWTLGLAAVGVTGYYSTLVIMQVFSR